MKNLSGISGFQQRIYVAIQKVPRGKVTTYQAIANHLHSKAYRAVGSACKKNPFAPQIPCHRVICSDGSLGGYQGKMSSKKKAALLQKEGIEIKKGNVVDFRNQYFKF